MLSECSNYTRLLKAVVFTNEVGRNSRYFEGVFTKTVIPLTQIFVRLILLKPQVESISQQ